MKPTPTSTLMSTYAPALLMTALLVVLTGSSLWPNSEDTADRVTNREHLGNMAWSSKQWQESCAGVRTSFNPDADLSDSELTIVPGDPRWLDFVYWTLNNKIAEHQVEQYGGTNWDGPVGGVVFHWAPGSHWERDTLASFGFTIGHTIGEHRWSDTMFPDFFEKYGGVYGVNVKDRITEIDPTSPGVWVEFLEHIGGPTSPYYRYLFHQETLVDPELEEVHLVGGQGVAFTYSFERYYHELREVLTDCRAVDFFKMYDQFGHGFASQGNWAEQGPREYSLAGAGYKELPDDSEPRERYNPNPPLPEIPDDLPEREAMLRGQAIYQAQCTVCHGAEGNGAGFLAEGFDVAPRDFTRGVFEFRTTADRELPRIEDLERVIHDGVPGTTMPAWGQFLSQEQIHDVARYLVVFSEKFQRAWRAGEVAPEFEVPDPPTDLASLEERGRGVAERLLCASCHGPEGRGNGDSAETLMDDWRNPTSPGDWTNPWSFQGGHSAQDLYRSIFGTLTGSGMPEFATATPEEADRWAVVAYVMKHFPDKRPVIRLDEFAEARRTRIGERGNVLPEKR